MSYLRIKHNTCTFLSLQGLTDLYSSAQLLQRHDSADKEGCPAQGPRKGVSQGLGEAPRNSIWLGLSLEFTFTLGLDVPWLSVLREERKVL